MAKKPNPALASASLLGASTTSLMGGGAAGIGAGASKSLMVGGASLAGSGGGAALFEAPEGPKGPLDDLDGETAEERAADMLNRSRAILVNQEQRASQQQAIELANDTEFWFAVYFQDRAQKEAFLAGIGYAEKGDGDKYVDGQKLAARMGITLPPRAAPFKVGALDRKLKDMAQ